jgi:hypothetical protein
VAVAWTVFDAVFWSIACADAPTLELASPSGAGPCAHRCPPVAHYHGRRVQRRCPCRDDCEGSGLWRGAVVATGTGIASQTRACNIPRGVSIGRPDPASRRIPAIRGHLRKGITTRSMNSLTSGTCPPTSSGGSSHANLGCSCSQTTGRADAAIASSASRRPSRSISTVAHSFVERAPHTTGPSNTGLRPRLRPCPRSLCSLGG